MRLIGLSVLAFFFPLFAQAAVVINEIAWMGSTGNANAEWIELANSGSAAVDLAGWRLSSDNGTPSITLAGSISANGYFLLERTSDATVPGITADQIYTGALSNSGVTLTLVDANSATADQVAGGAGWTNIGGNNTTKETAQRTAIGWETATATPRALNAGVSPPNSANPDGSATTTAVAASSGADGSPPQYAPIPALRVVISGSRVISSGADTVFTAVVYDSKGNKRTDAGVTWSFGDGMRKAGASVFHAYYNPGEYVAVARASTPDGGEALSEMTVTVEDATVKIVSLSSRGITLANSGSHTLDLSFWRLLAGGQEFKIPEDTKILPGGTVLFPSEVLGLPFSSAASLLYPNGKVAATYPAAIPAAPADVSVQLSTNDVGYEKVQAVEPEVGKSVSDRAHDIPAVSAPAAVNELAAAGAASPLASSSSPSYAARIFNSPWLLGLIGVILLAGSAFIFL